MIITNPLIEAYISVHTDGQSKILEELERQTHLKAVNPRMLSGKVQGNYLSLISKMVKPKVVLELGTFTGYSALCLAEGLADGGRLYTIDIDDEIVDLAKEFVCKSELADNIEFLVGDALDVLENLDISPDLVFIDADKKEYISYYSAILPKMKKGSIMLVDNVLWDGKVADSTVTDADTQAIRQFNEFVSNDSRVSNVILPLRDGLMLLMKN